MNLSPGERLGHYTIVSRIGAGGMGEVYHARDGELGRDVAIKVLPEGLTSDAQALNRFQREARAVAALSHPNVVAIHQFDSAASPPYLVMELLQGETLGSKIARSVVPWRKAMEIGAGIADALVAAHDRGIVHRDLKPANIWITTEGQVKVLDFGLARQQTGGEEMTNAPTQTRPGVVLGTVGYMAPEQVTGGTIDHRTDIFALGCILYQMLTGRNPFARDTPRETAAAILGDDPMARMQAADVAPPEVRRLIGRCLEKNPNERFQSARDLAVDLRELFTGRSAVTTASRRRLGLWAALFALLVVVSAAAFWFAVRESNRVAPAEEVRSLIVIPFESTTGVLDSEVLADGITEGLINTLATLPRVRVLARTTSFTFKDKPLDFGRLRRDLNVDAALTGRIVVRGESLTVQADLVDLASGSALWGDRYHQPVSNPQTIEQTIVTAIAERLRVRLTSEEAERLQRRSTSSREAYQLYLRGRHEWHKRTPEGLRRAKELFEEAIAADPTFALAYSGLADTYVLLAGDFQLMPRPEGLRRAEEAARRGVELDPHLAEARTSLALVRHNMWQWLLAEAEFERALELNPNYATARMWYGLGLRDVGRFEESVRETRAAQQLDPLAPIVTANLAHKLLTIRAYDQAKAEAQRALELNPHFPYGHWNLALAFEGQREYARAADSYQRLTEVAGPAGLGRAGLARMAAKSGRSAEALAVARELEEQARSGTASFTVPATVYSALGDRDKALELLEEAFRRNESLLRHNVRLPCLAELEGDPRYADLLRRMVERLSSRS